MVKKDFTSGAYWDAFGRMLPVEKPTPKEAADYVTKLHVEIDNLKRELLEAEKKRKLAIQQFQQFALEVSNLANKHSSMVDY